MARIVGWYLFLNVVRIGCCCLLLSNGIGHGGCYSFHRFSLGRQLKIDFGTACAIMLGGGFYILIINEALTAKAVLI